MEKYQLQAKALLDAMLPIVAGADRYNHAQLYHKAVAKQAVLRSIRNTIATLEEAIKENNNKGLKGRDMNVDKTLSKMLIEQHTLYQTLLGMNY